MDPADFDRLVALARDPRLIPGIYNYCDGRCPRCPFNERCLTYLDNRDRGAGRPDAALAAAVQGSLERTRDMIFEVARREGLDPAALEERDADERTDEGVERDPQDALAREYGTLAWRVAQALQPVVARRGDAAVVEAVDTIEWFSTLISAKVRRAIAGYADGGEDRDGVQTDFNGSAKVALIGIAESLAAWCVLMEAGRATANGVPAYAVKLLNTLDHDIRARFPRAMDFVRPGFDCLRTV